MPSCPISHTNIRVGSRRSRLALAQVDLVEQALRSCSLLDGVTWSVNAIDTEGDRNLQTTLDKIGGKGLFTKELDKKLFDGACDIVVHSMKDMETTLPEGVEILATLPRADARDVLISSKGEKCLRELPEGARIGTSSLRRGAQLKRVRPDLEIIPVRGNVQTRLSKMEEGHVDALILAKAGLDRLGLSLGCVLSDKEMLPAVAQGAICIVGLVSSHLRDFFAPIHDEETLLCTSVERAFLRALDGNCHTPIAAFAQIRDGLVYFRGKVLSPDGELCYFVERELTKEGAEQESFLEGMRLKDKMQETKR